MKLSGWSFLLVNLLAVSSCTNDDVVTKAVKAGKPPGKYDGTGNGLPVKTTTTATIPPTTTTPVDNSGVPNGGRGTYYAGVAQNEAGIAVASYWKDGVLNNLATIQSYGYAIAVTATDVYVAGQMGGNATVWKNGKPFTLCTEPSTAFSIVVVGDDIYVAGDIMPGNGFSYAIIWKNGVATKMTEDVVYSQASQLLIVGSDVYLSGSIYKEGKNYAAYWKNGEATLLTAGSPYQAFAKSIAIDGSDVYATLYEGDRIAKYWHNGQVVILADESSSSVASAITLHNGDVYVAGMTGGISQGEGRVTYWKNGTRFVNINDPVKPCETGSIFVAGDDVYIAGSTVESPIGPTWSSAKYWINGVATELPGGYDGINVDFANAMCIYSGEGRN